MALAKPRAAAASTAPAKAGSYPNFFIIGMVKLPVPATLATELPDTVPIKPLDNTATFAGPPRAQPAKALAKSIKMAKKRDIYQYELPSTKGVL